MIEAKSIPDGFNLSLGSYLTQLAAWETMAFIIRKPPTYEGDEERTQSAKWLFWILWVLHLSLAVFIYLLTFKF